MVCTKCNQVLFERYNGQLFCAKCGADGHGEQLRITAENEKLFGLAELCFLRHISPAKGVLHVQRNVLDDAFELCKMAATSGHPKALFRMGYFYEFYLKERHGETERVQRAFEYYWRLCNPNTHISITQMTQPGVICTSLQNENDWLELQKQAAYRILDLFALFPWAFGGGVNNRYQRAKKHLLVTFKREERTANGEESAGKRANEIQRVLSSCYQKNRPPLLGLFKIKATELRELLALRANAAEGRKHGMNKMCEDLLFHYLVCNKHGALRSRAEFVRIREAEFPTDVLSDEDYLYFLFINKSGKHAHLSGAQLRRFVDEVVDDQSEMLDFISGSSGKELLLFEEDIIYMKKILKGKFESLIANICEEE